YFEAGVPMWNIGELVIAFVVSCATTLLVTPIIIKLALKLNITDKPDSNRKIHNGIKPSMGGLAILIGAAAGFIYLQPLYDQLNAIVIGACIMIITEIVDDVFEIRVLYKLIGQISAAIVVVSSGLVIEKLTIPFMGTVYIDD